MTQKKILLIAVLFFWPTVLAAQDGSKKTIDLFENQNSMPSKGIQIEGSGPSAEPSEWSGDANGGFTIRFERMQNSILVPVNIKGKKVYFVFDTGATFTTLPSKFARSVGVYPKKSYPQTMVETANGRTMTQFGYVPALRFGTQTHTNVSFTICDACPHGTFKGKQIVGLLGMNVLGRYATSLDDSTGTIKLRPSGGFRNRLRDVRPWVQLARPGVYKKGSGSVMKTFFLNRSPVKLKRLDIAFTCDGKRQVLKVKNAKRGQNTVQKKFGAAKCESAEVELVGAEW